MTILKQMLIASAFLIGTQPLAQAYKVAEFKTETTQILDFIEVLRCYGTREAKKVAKWLKKHISGSYHFSDTDILNIARTISSYETIDAKIATLMKKATDESIKKIKQEKRCMKADLEEAKILLPLFGAAIACYGFGVYNILARAVANTIKDHDASLLSKAQEMINASANVPQTTGHTWFKNTPSFFR